MSIEPAPDSLAGLNGPQQQAAAGDGPLLVVAGPGTGKTLTIVQRLACLVDRGVPARDIAAVTFTNRAAREMQERTAMLLGPRGRDLFIGTLHLLGLAIIREHRGRDLTLLGRDGQVEVLRSLAKLTVKQAQDAIERISGCKNRLQAPPPDLAALYHAYHDALLQKNALDLDDLISQSADILEQGRAGRRFQHVIVDEYQDINPAQYRLLRLLAAGGEGFCAVGDADQAIYAFRGADLGSFLSFERDFPGAGRVVLTENYRSQALVLAAADAVIRNNHSRIEKEIVPTRPAGPPVAVISAPDEQAEAEEIVRTIESALGGTSHDQMRRSGPQRDGQEGARRFADFAVLYRTHAQARALEEAFLGAGIPYQLVGRKGGVRARELEEMLAYLRSFLPREAADAKNGTSPEELLLAPVDLYDPRADAVALLSLHMAKGLEFPVVFLAGVEEGLLPCTLIPGEVDVEEERRLFYVGMTRAKEELHLSFCRKRFLYGERRVAGPSRFLAELPQDLVEMQVLPDRQKKQKEPDRQMGLF